MKVSVLLPTRSRPKSFLKSIISLIDNADNFHNNVEILVAMDTDDFHKYTDVMNILINDYNCKNIKLYVCERLGYRKLNIYINNLCKLATGDWLFLWNDDSYIVSKHWDTNILKHNDEFKIINPRCTNGDFGGMPFPIIPKTWFDTTGCFSKHFACDTWIQRVGSCLGFAIYYTDIYKEYKKELNICLKNQTSSKKIKSLVEIIDKKKEQFHQNKKLEDFDFFNYYTSDIMIEHDRYDTTGNNKDQTFIEGTNSLHDEGDTSSETFFSKENGDLIEEDFEKLYTFVKREYNV
jgi:hypothetical protein